MNDIKEIQDEEIYEFKIITLGERGVGKSSIIKRFLGNSFDANIGSTIGLDSEFRSITLKNNKKVRLMQFYMFFL